jgi:hypothetical protein
MVRVLRHNRKLQVKEPVVRVRAEEAEVEDRQHSQLQLQKLLLRLTFLLQLML